MFENSVLSSILFFFTIIIKKVDRNSINIFYERLKLTKFKFAFKGTISLQTVLDFFLFKNY